MARNMEFRLEIPDKITLPFYENPMRNPERLALYVDRCVLRY